MDRFLIFKHLNLRNCQSLDPRKYIPYTAVLNITGLLCPMGHTLLTADLSFNDIIGVTIDVKSVFCLKSLKVLDLRYNLILNVESVYNGDYIRLATFIFFYSVEYALF